MGSAGGLGRRRCVTAAATGAAAGVFALARDLFESVAFTARSEPDVRALDADPELTDEWLVSAGA